MNHPYTTPAAALCASILLIAASAHSEAGPATVRAVPDTEPIHECNPLSFFDGMLVFDFEERFRWEIRNNNFDFNDSINALTDDNWFLQRMRFGMTVKPAPWLKLYVQGQDSREINSDRPDFPGVLGAEGDDAFDLRQAWIEFGNAKDFPLTLKVGRQVLSYGDERLIGSFDWNNIGRTFDAVKLRWEEKDWWLDAFASSVVVPTRGKYNQSDFFNGNETHREQIFSGLYFSTTAVGPQTTDLYVLHLHENTSPAYQPAAVGDTNFFTIGARVKSKPGAFAAQPAHGVASDGKTALPPAAPKAVGFDYDAELAFQTGKVRGLDLTAFAAHGGAGYTFDTAWLPRLGLAYSFATGDHNAADDDVQTFQNLFPTNHKFYGQMDVFAWQNVHDLEVSVKAQPVKAVSVKAEYHAFWLANTDDAWYRANGVTTVRPITPSASSYAGSEVDFTVQWNVNKHLQVEGGYSHFFAGDYLRDTGPSDDADFGYIQAKLTF
jgi:hypothetical protein